jgi:exonuclease III
LAGVSGNHYDLICVTETWFNDSILDQVVISANPYKVFRCDRMDKIGGGCAIFVNNRLNVKQIIMPSNVILSNIQAVCIEVYIQSHLYVVCCIYNPPGVSQQCMLDLINIFDFLCSKYHSVLLCGDFNLPNFAENLYGIQESRYSQFENIVVQYGLEQLVTEPTRLQSILDLVFCTSYLSCSKISILPPFANSDHNCISFAFLQMRIS